MADTWEIDNLRAIRRPKPPSLKEQALDELELHVSSKGYLHRKSR
jgi:hypothetical protein